MSKIRWYNSKTAQLISETDLEIIKALDDDLNISRAIGVLFDFIHAVNTRIHNSELTIKDKDAILDALKKFDTIFGFIFFNDKESSIDSQEIEKLIQERIDAKQNKNFARADEIRDYLLDNDIILEDTKDGTRWKIK